MTGIQHDAQGRLTRLLEEVDPLAREILDCVDPRDAYDAVQRLSSTLMSDLGEPATEYRHQGTLYVAWASLNDLHDAGKVPKGEALDALRGAATDWLEWPAERDDAFIVEWLDKATDRHRQLVNTYGDFWSEAD